MAAVYGINPFGLSARQLIGLWANIPAVEAHRELSARRAEGPLSHERLFDLILVSTGDREQAERASRELLAATLRAGQTPDV